MGFDLWKREFLHVWRASRTTVILHHAVASIPIFLVLVLLKLSPLAGVLVLLPLCFGAVIWWAHVQVAAYMLAGGVAEESVGVRGPLELMKGRWGAVFLGYLLYVALYMVGSTFVLPGLAIAVVLAPYLLFIVLEKQGPVEALETNVRLAGPHLGGLALFWLALFGVMLVGTMVVGLLAGGLIVMAAAMESEMVVPLLIGVAAFGLLIMMLVSMSVHVAAAVASYRVLRGETLDAAAGAGSGGEAWAAGIESPAVPGAPEAGPGQDTPTSW
ncbi:hypothetical protein DL240_17895 [Lujinxingia litoralis]|uniref:Glycerophosphoryl diester phosphodiesterase membrane domain-containing protein n=1 Tax=Lujinxingia litoralis TaxID=2211119 RepID=A0A328C4L8_9DELT|nr:hypothetical protein [Lujinxingia litoralis]RAL20252.1 hypothetical protein DL240_17895 [Lujinxingia litoralis]